MTLPRFQSQRRTTEGAQHGSADGGGDSSRALHVVTFGCQMNKYDSLLVEGRFTSRGYRVTDRMDDADVIVFNTCSVRDHAEERVYSWVGELRRAKEQRPDLVIGVMGCMAQRAEEEIFGRAAHVDIVCGTRQIHNMPDLVEELVRRRADPERSSAPDRRLLETDMNSAVAVDREREEYTGGLSGYLAVMRGCDLNCTYCIVPRVRGRVQSRPITDLVAEARWMVAGGARVITLLGQTVNSYGEDLERPGPGEPQLGGRQGRASLADLLRALQEVDGLERIRLVTLHPSYVTPELAQAIRDCPKVDRFLPIPMQSGSDEVLRRMKRGYTVDLYRRRVAILREAVPDIELGSDWIVGFPGESDEDFQLTLELQRELGFVQNYVFKYDPRPETTAHQWPDDVAVSVKKARNQELLRASERVALSRFERWIGETVTVFVESEAPKSPGTFRGLSAHGLPVSFPAESVRIGSTQLVTVSQASPFGLAGSLVDSGAESARAVEAPAATR